MIFIIGVGRSGTSLVQSMLNAHSQVSFIPEISYIRRFLKRNPIVSKEMAIKLLLADPRLKRLDVPLAEILSDTPGTEINLYQVYLDIVANYRKKQGKPIIGDKDPRCIEFIPRLYRYFPGAYIVHVVRDPRDVIVSKTKAAWSKNRSIHNYIFANLVQMQLANRHAPLFGSNYLIVQYEKLLQNPIEILSQLCQKLELEFEPSMLSFNKSAQELMAEEEYQWKKETLGPLMQDNIDKWLGSLTPLQVGLIEDVLDHIFKTYDYKKSNPKLFIYQKIFIKFLKMFYYTLDVVYRYGRIRNQ
ncbi:MAG: sulfotransferase [Candidatus Marinimicrobia bacterium]|nr:sulfotransferase [Candidatus Neomarinimicrobiota bacterium]